jgi:hypothetical protein
MNTKIHPPPLLHPLRMLTSLAACAALLTLPTWAQNPPKIADEPQDCIVSLGGDATFKVRATASAPAQAEWYYTDGSSHSLLLSAENQPRMGVTLTVSNVQAAVPGGYYAVITNEWGTATSRVATLTIDPTFIKITGQPIVEDLEQSEVAVWFDYDGDGWLDLFVGSYLYWGPEALQPNSSFYRNQRDGSFTRVNNELTTTLRGIYGVVCADYNNDGRIDVYLSQPTDFDMTNSRMFLNEGDWSIRVLPPNLGGAFNAAARDIDGDGWVDLALFRWYNSTLVYRNLGEGQFELVPESELGDLRGVSSAGGQFVDFDNDGRPDLHLGRDSARAISLRNVGGFSFERFTGAGSFPGTLNTFSTGWADYDNDGFFDVLTVRAEWESRDAPRLHRNVPDPIDPSQRVFEDVTESSGLHHFTSGLGPPWQDFGHAWGDFNNDGHLDLFFPRGDKQNMLLVNQGDGTFVAVDVGGPIHEGGYAKSGVWGDYDNDGFLDLFIANNGDAPRNLLYRNNLKATGNQNGWLKVQLDGRVSNRSGIGAVIRLQATIAGRQMWQTRQIAANGRPGTELLAHFGLGDAAKVDVLRIEWPSGLVQELTDLEPNQSLTIVETQHAPSTQLPTVTSTSTDDGFHVTVTCPTEPMSNLRCVLEGSRDLVTWTKVMVRANESGAMEFSDPHAASHPKRFYRVVVP